MTAQAKLTDTQAASRPDGNIEPPPSTLRGGARAKVIEGLLARGLISDADGHHLLTDAGYASRLIDLLERPWPLPENDHELDPPEISLTPAVKAHLTDCGERHSKIKLGRGSEVRMMPGITLIREWDRREYRRRSGGRKVVIPAATGDKIPEHDAAILTVLSKAFHWQRLFNKGIVSGGSGIARREGLHQTTVNELLRLTLLSPTLVRGILDGRQPKSLSLLWLKNHLPPSDWNGQHQLFNGFDA